ncbi:hypothetical protein HYW32_01675 [Candidatus Berkelbacteria bacterium]|nr:hypothetical protein [Candidatus Berkelbacteria bacterium]
MPNVFIPKEYERTRELVAIPKKKYEAYLEAQRAQARPAKHAQSKRDQELTEVLEIIRRGKADYRAGRIRTVQSLSELME